jgi:hypothetical protein
LEINRKGMINIHATVNCKKGQIKMVYILYEDKMPKPEFVTPKEGSINEMIMNAICFEY